MNKYLLVISKDYWGTSTSESTALRFTDRFKNFAGINDMNVTTLFNGGVTVSNVKDTIYKSVKAALSLDVEKPRLYIYMNGHGNQIIDTNGDEWVSVYNGETSIDAMDEVGAMVHISNITTKASYSIIMCIYISTHITGSEGQVIFNKFYNISICVIVIIRPTSYWYISTKRKR